MQAVSAVVFALVLAFPKTRNTIQTETYFVLKRILKTDVLKWDITGRLNTHSIELRLVLRTQRFGKTGSRASFRFVCRLPKTFLSFLRSPEWLFCANVLPVKSIPLGQSLEATCVLEQMNPFESWSVAQNADQHVQRTTQVVHLSQKRLVLTHVRRRSFLSDNDCLGRNSTEKKDVKARKPF